MACLEAVRSLKRLRSGNYPVMAVSKNLHFYNPRLFVIYDSEVVVGQVYRAFRKDWNGGYRRFASTGDGWLDFYLAYLLWASHMIRNAYPGFMEDFADWFIEELVRVAIDCLTSLHNVIKTPGKRARFDNPSVPAEHAGGSTDSRLRAARFPYVEAHRQPVDAILQVPALDQGDEHIDSDRADLDERLIDRC